MPAAVVEDEVVADAPEASVGGPSWMPVPVPRPSYTLKPSVRRDEPAPLVLDEDPAAGAAPAAPVAPVADAPTVSEPPAAAHPAAADATPAEATGGFDLDAVLARRRAAGE